MTGFSPPPPPQAARAIVRQLFSLRGSSPRVSATALEEHDTHESSIEFLNEGSQADNVRCLVRVDGELEELPIGNLAPETSMVARLRAPLGANFECIWTALDAKGRTHVWSYDGKHVRLRRGQELDLRSAYERMYAR